MKGEKGKIEEGEGRRGEKRRFDLSVPYTFYPPSNSFISTITCPLFISSFPSYFSVTFPLTFLPCNLSFSVSSSYPHTLFFHSIPSRTVSFWSSEVIRLWKEDEVNKHLFLSIIYCNFVLSHMVYLLVFPITSCHVRLCYVR